MALGAAAASLIAAGIGATANIGTSLYNRYKDEKMIEKQNEYNSPSSQLQRYMMAGLNPNAVMQGMSGSDSAGNMAAGDYANMTPALDNNLGNMLGNSVNNALNAENIAANIQNTKENTRGEKISNDMADATFDARVEQCLNEGIITEAQAKNAKVFAERYPELVDISVEQAHAELDKTYEQIKEIRKNIDATEQKIKESQKLIDKYEQDIKTSKSQEAKNRAEIALTAAKTENEKLQNELQSMKNQNFALTGEESGYKAQYFSIADKEGKEAADKWLDVNMEVTNKVIENSSKATAQGQLEAKNELDPQAKLKKQYNDQMEAEIKQIEEDIKYLEEHNVSQKVIDNRRKDIDKVQRKYRNKMRRVDKGFGGGFSIFGTGANAGG